MQLEQELAERVLAAHPREAAQLAERLDVDAVAGLLGSAEAKAAAGMLAQMAPHAAGRALAGVPAERATAIVSELPVDLAALFLRAIPAETRAPLLGALGVRRARALEALLGFSEDTAGALMDPEVLALPEDLTAEEAIARVREAAHAARYNLYVVDREQHLVGVINLRELLLAPLKATIASFMTRQVRRLPANADRVAVVSHPAWREVHSLPVVDRNGVYLGAIRYRVFRQLEDAMQQRSSDPSQTARALGDLFRTGGSAVLEMLSAPLARGGGQTDGR